MSTEISERAARAIVELMIDELHRSAARNIALSQQPEIQRRVHDSRIYRERAEADLLAAKHLMGELA